MDSGKTLRLRADLSWNAIGDHDIFTDDKF